METDMRIALVGCVVMNREISYLISGSRNQVRTWWLEQGLHNTPDLLRVEVQKKIDEIEKENAKAERGLGFDAIVLAYGLCSNGVLGLRSRSLPVIVPRCDDCISLFLGSADRYRALFAKLPGTYWYNAGWIEYAFVPCREKYDALREEYAEKYGEDNADYLMECNESWMREYNGCCYITCPLEGVPDYEDFAKRAAEEFGWKYSKVDGKMEYLDELVNGPWSDEHFLTCPPGSEIIADYSNRKFRSAPYTIDDRETTG